ncbi:hypothetical protein UPYG_G00157540 [Umbra pygmaea]|uniref:Uncharacterized protein n=1 Tax=Umbra pygmaea TaxID=75934 RepID=A0ABD0X315_UMBPY
MSTYYWVGRTEEAPECTRLLYRRLDLRTVKRTILVWALSQVQCFFEWIPDAADEAGCGRSPVSRVPRLRGRLSGCLACITHVGVASRRTLNCSASCEHTDLLLTDGDDS